MNDLTPEEKQRMPYGSCPFQIGDRVRVKCAASHYYEVLGEIRQIQFSTGYVILDMPRGTERKLENIKMNKILAEIQSAVRKRKTPIKWWPRGDPQWFPWNWLEPFDDDIQGQNTA